MHKANAAPASHRVLAYLEGRQTLSGTTNRKSIVALLLALLGSLYLWQIHRPQAAQIAVKPPVVKVHSKAAPTAEPARIVHDPSNAAATTTVTAALTNATNAAVAPVTAVPAPKRSTTTRPKPALQTAIKSTRSKYKVAQQTTAPNRKAAAKNPVFDPDAELLAKLLERRDPRSDSLDKGPYSTQQ